MPNAQSLPVLSYSTGAGWTTLGHATSERAAKRIVMKSIGDASKSLVHNHGFDVVVSRRTELQRELNGGPDGFIYTVGKTVKRATSKRVTH